MKEGKLLKVMLKPIGNSIVYYVVYQAESQRYAVSRAPKKDESVLTFKAKNGWSVRSAAQPSLDVDIKTIHLRGDTKDRDEIVRVIDFYTPAERDSTLAEIKEALGEWSKNGGFGDNAGAKKEAGEDDIYEF